MSARNFGEEFYCNGVYSIYCHITDFIYFGSAASEGGIAKRLNRHIRELGLGIHKNPVLQRDWNRYGIDSFTFSVVEKCEPSECLRVEQFWIDSRGVGDKNRSYNVSPTAGNTLGITFTEEHRRKIGLHFKGKPKPEEQRRKMSEAQKGKPKPSVSAAKKGVPRKDPSKCATYGFKGKKHSEETKEKIRRANQGRKLSSEQVENMRQRVLKALEESPHERERLLEMSKKGRIAIAKIKSRTYVATPPSGEQILLTGLRAFCQENGLSQPKMSDVVSGRRKHHKGWSCRLATQEDALNWKGQRWFSESVLAT